MGWVYVIGMDGTTLVKIGQTHTSPETRLKSLQTGIPYRLKLLKVYACENQESVEKKLHRLLQNARAIGEWFDTGLAEIDALFLDALIPDPPIVSSVFGKNLLYWRTRRGLTIRALSKASGVSFPSVSKIERGVYEPSWLTACKLAEVLHVPIDEFRKER